MIKRYLDLFWYFVQERHNIYLRRLRRLPKPWTDDEILQSYRFCNVYRELDTVTEWIRENWRLPFGRNQYLWFGMTVARMINHIPTLKTLGFPGEGMASMWRYEALLKRMTERSDKVYGSAYVITAGGRSGPKYQYTMECFKEALKRAPAFSRTDQKVSVKTMWEQLRHLPGAGPFIAYEIATDLRWTRYCDMSDIFTWANPGPGAMRGLSWIYKGEPNHRRGIDHIRAMQALLAMAPERAPLLPRMEMRDIEHCLCEVDKYLRAKSGQGRPKQKYQGAA